ncbi:MAG: mucoidy inhibitor MuiA family protein [Bacteroidales bacterium]
MNKLFFILVSLFFLQVTYGSNEEKTVASKIDRITVFVDHAQVVRQAGQNLSAGTYTLTFSGLSPYANPNSIRVKGRGYVKVLSVHYQKNPAVKKLHPEKIEQLQAAIRDLNKEKTEEQTWINFLAEDESYIKKSYRTGNSTEVISSEELKQRHQYYRDKLKSIRFERLKRERILAGLNDSIHSKQNRINRLSNETQDPSGEVIIEVSVSKYTQAQFELSYLVSNAGWYPSYDIRVEDTDKDVELSYKANIFQNTGISWDNVKLKLSNASHTQSDRMPQLNPYFIHRGQNNVRQRFQNVNKAFNPAIRHVSGYVRDASTGEPLPFVTIRTNTNKGTTSNENGFYSIDIPANASTLQYQFAGYGQVHLNVYSSQMNVFLQPSAQQLEAVRITAASAISEADNSSGYSKRKIAKEPEFKQPTATVSKQLTTIEFELEGRHQISNNGKAKIIAYQTKDIPSEFEYQCIPKLSEHAYLFAKIADWEDLNLMSGKANIYYDNTYLGETSLSANQLSDTMMISLGKDKQIVVSRQKLKDMSRKQLLGNNTRVDRTYQLHLTNNKNSSVNLRVFDQIPVSRINDVSVDVNNLSEGELDETNGFVEWKIELKAKTDQKLKLGYSVKYPKEMRLHIQ